VDVIDVLLKRAKSASGDTNTLAVNTDRLQVNILAATARNIGVAARIAEDSAFTGKLADAGHK
jgi:hypothetical protein